MKTQKATETFTNEELGLEPGERQFTKAEALAAAQKWMDETAKHPGYEAAYRRIKAQQKRRGHCAVCANVPN